MRSSGSKPGVGAPARKWRLVGAERKDESIPAFMRLSDLKLRYTDASFMSRLGLTKREVGVIEQIRAAVVAAHPGLFENESGHLKPPIPKSLPA